MGREWNEMRRGGGGEKRREWKEGGDAREREREWKGRKDLQASQEREASHYTHCYSE